MDAPAIPGMSLVDFTRSGHAMMQNHYAQSIVRIQVLTLGPARGDDEIVLHLTFLRRVVGQAEIDTLLVQFILEFWIIDVAFHDQIP